MIKTDKVDWIEDPNQVQSLFQSFYNNSYTSDIKISQWKPALLSFPKISAYDCNKLLDDLSVTEIKQAIFQMTPCKSSGPEGFFQKSWNYKRHHM